MSHPKKIFFDTNRLIFLIIMLLSPLPGIGIDLYTASLPAIANYFHTETYWSKLTIAIYLFGYGIGQPIFGPLSESYGRKQPLFIGILIYTLASFASAFTPNIYLLLIMRLLQGIGIAAAGVLTKSIVTDRFAEHQIHKIATYMSTAWALGPILAPALGGYFQVYWGWKAAFYFFTTYGLFLMFLILFYLPESKTETSDFRLSTVFEHYKIVLSNTSFLGYLICMSIVYSLLTLFNTIGPFLIQNQLSFSAIDYGHIALLLGIAFFFGNLMNRFAIQYFSVQQIFITSTLLALIVSLIMLILAFIQLKLSFLVIPVFITFFLSGFIFPNAMGSGMKLFQNISGIANAAMGLIFVVGTAIINGIGSLFHSDNAIALAGLFCCLLFLCLITEVKILPQKTV